MVKLEDFHQYFIQSVLADAESRGTMKPQSFFEIVSEDLVSVGDLTNNYALAEYIKKGIEVYGYDFDEERKILTLLSHHFFQEETIQTLSKQQIDTKFTRLKTFFNKCIQGLHEIMEETSDAYSMAYNVKKYLEKNQVDKIRLMIFTDGRVTRNLVQLPSENVGTIQFDFRIIDIEYLHNIYSSKNQNATFAVHVDLPCLKINEGSDLYESFLSVVSGDLLFDIYEDHGQKLFEQNVRTFLQFRGYVNKGLRNTIEYTPEMFFAYNNGITATATAIDFHNSGNIKRIENFQIVNGGQTTSAIYAAKKNSGTDVSKVSVQMKLSVVKNEMLQDDFISKVAEYANTQNKINNSDFFSNSPFHKDMKEYSVRVYAPAIGGSQRRTHWFYERVRGEYLNSQAYLSNEAKKRFIFENPTDQVIDKTLLSKTENAWWQRPDIVSKGAQDSFKKFADKITELLEKDSLAITETYFKDAISRVILFRAVGRIVTKAPWYDNGFRAQTVAYTVSFLSYLINKSGLNFNFNLIWENQSIPEVLTTVIEEISEKVYFKITNPGPGYANITQWTKNVGCWESVKQIDYSIEDLDDCLFIDKEEKKFIIKESKKNKELDKGIDMQIFVVKVDIKAWKMVFDYYCNYKSNAKITSMQMDILRKMSEGKIKVPSESQSKILYQLYNTAKEEGLNLA
jgi:hypothetical protein